MGKTSIEEVINLINANGNLYRDFKYQLGKSLIEYISSDRTVDLDKYKDNFSKLKTERAHSIANKVESYLYNPVTNVITINEKYLMNSDVNQDNIYMQMTLDLLFSNGKIKGFAGEGLQALNKGFRETLATKLVGEERKENFTSDEYVYTQIIGRIISADILIEAYKTNNVELIKQILANHDLTRINELADYNMQNRNSTTKNSELARIQVQLFRYCEIHNIGVDDIINNMVLNSQIFEQSIKYSSLDNLNKIIITSKVQGNISKSLS